MAAVATDGSTLGILLGCKRTIHQQRAQKRNMKTINIDILHHHQPLVTKAEQIETTQKYWTLKDNDHDDSIEHYNVFHISFFI